MRYQDMIKKIITEGKVPESVMTRLEDRFAANRGKFKSATEKFIAVRDAMASRTQDKEMQNFIKSVTPGDFFRYKKGNREMVIPDEPVSNDKYEYKPVTPKQRAEKIPFKVDTTGNFTALSDEIFNKHLYPAIIQYYKNTYHNSMPSRELAKHIAWTHYSHSDDITMDTVLKSLNAAHTDSTVKRRIDDDTIVAKSVEHFGFKSKDEMKTALEGEYQYVQERISAKRKQQFLSNPKTLSHNQYHQDQRDAAIYQPMLMDAKMSIVKAYLKRDARSLDKYTKEYQLIKYVFNR